MSITPQPPTLGARALTVALSRPVSGLVGAAVAVRLTPRVLRALGLEFESDLSQWAVRIGGGGVGFALGYGYMSVLHWLRWRLLRVLLSYQGWLYHPKATSTTVRCR